MDDFAVGREIGGDDGFAVTQTHHEDPAVVNASVGDDQGIAGLEQGIPLLITDITVVQMDLVLDGRLHQRLNQVLRVHIPGAACNNQVNIRVMDQVHGLQKNIQALGLFDLSKKQKGHGSVF